MRRNSSGCDSCDTNSLVASGSAPSSLSSNASRASGATSRTSTTAEAAGDLGVHRTFLVPQSPSARRKRIAIKLDRSPLTHHEFLSSYAYQEKEPLSVKERTKSVLESGVTCAHGEWKEVILSHVPMLRWLPKYSVKKDLIADFIAGITVAVMHIPQGMAYALLAGLPPVNGLYMAFFPVLVHLVFSTSRHNSVGTFAMVLLMTGTLSQEILDKRNNVHPAAALSVHDDSDQSLVDGPAHVEFAPKHIYEATETVALVAFCVGIWQIAMGLMRIGALSVILSDVLVSGLTTGASIHIVTSQITGVLGVSVPKQMPFPRLIRTYIYLADHVYESNVVAIVVSVVTITALAVNNDYVKPRLAKRCRFPVPIELLAIVGGTCYSHFMELNKKYNLPIVGIIRTGIPSPKLPPFEIMEDVLLGSLFIAIVAFTTSYSMASIFAKRLNYEVDANQELLAHGMANVLGSFFQCGPSAASLSRSLIQQSVGGRTQISSAVSAGLVLVILLFLGPLFNSLPMCILSSIILSSLKGLFVQFADFGKAWKSSKLDALIWISTFASVVIIDIDYGLGIGVAVSIITLLWRNQRAYASILGEIPNTGIYVDCQRFAAAKEIPTLKIFHYGAGLHFANRDYFREMLFTLSGLDPVHWHKQAMKRMKKERAQMSKDIKEKAGAWQNKVLGRSGSRDSLDSVTTAATTMTRGSIVPKPWLCCFGSRSHEPGIAERSSHYELEGLGRQSDSAAEPIPPPKSILRPSNPNYTEIREITIDAKSLRGGVTVGDSLALPASTGLRLRRRSIHMDTSEDPLPFRYLLIDLSGISFIDMAGVKLLKSLVQDYDRINIQVLFAGTSEPVLHMFRKMSFYEDVPKQCFFPTVNDAVACVKWRGVGAPQKEKLVSVQEHEEDEHVHPK